MWGKVSTVLKWERIYLPAPASDLSCRVSTPRCWTDDNWVTALLDLVPVSPIAGERISPAWRVGVAHIIIRTAETRKRCVSLAYLTRGNAVDMAEMSPGRSTSLLARRNFSGPARQRSPFLQIKNRNITLARLGKKNY